MHLSTCLMLRLFLSTVKCKLVFECSAGEEPGRSAPPWLQLLKESFKQAVNFKYLLKFQV